MSMPPNRTQSTGHCLRHTPHQGSFMVSAPRVPQKQLQVSVRVPCFLPRPVCGSTAKVVCLVREHIKQTSARGPWGNVFFPTRAPQSSFTSESTTHVAYIWRTSLFGTPDRRHRSIMALILTQPRYYPLKSLSTQDSRKALSINRRCYRR